ncbi:MAG TPA: hypothetical protein PLK77_07455 [Pyrinomonadaceae bacterium]|nr:hypothetical protein [Pyrinomonadaceae bacterium]
MTRGISYLLLAILLAGSVIVSDAQTNALAKAQQVTGDRFTIRMRTPGGATIYAVKKPSDEMIEAIDDGLADLLAVARKNGYRRMLSPSNYTIFIAKADRQKNSEGVYSPDIAIGAAQYAGTDYDQGGYIYVAGMVISNNPLTFAIAEHTKDFNRVRDVVRYEGEHLVLYHNDRQRYMQTRDHSKGGSHPILQ